MITLQTTKPKITVSIDHDYIQKLILKYCHQHYEYSEELRRLAYDLPHWDETEILGYLIETGLKQFNINTKVNYEDINS